MFGVIFNQELKIASPKVDVIIILFDQLFVVGLNEFKILVGLVDVDQV